MSSFFAQSASFACMLHLSLVRWTRVRRARAWFGAMESSAVGAFGKMLSRGRLRGFRPVRPTRDLLSLLVLHLRRPSPQLRPSSLLCPISTNLRLDRRRFIYSDRLRLRTRLSLARVGHRVDPRPMRAGVPAADRAGWCARRRRGDGGALGRSAGRWKLFVRRITSADLPSCVCASRTIHTSIRTTIPFRIPDAPGPYHGSCTPSRRRARPYVWPDGQAVRPGRTSAGLCTRACICGGEYESRGEDEARQPREDVCVGSVGRRGR
ncbi:hypothetical protein B0H14DRAFT_2981558 [Mycena olivaceomarginata]|nr:hypothetical protein B0H14DRAFT_2981558 [Mycena olivaceomarginata]